MYENSAIEPSKNWGLGQQYYVGEKLTIILYNCINRHAGTPNVLTFFPPDWGMLRRSSCVLIFL